MIYGISYSEQQKSVPAQLFQYSIILSLETFLGTKNTKKKRYKGVSTEVDKHLDSIKEKLQKNKMGCLP